MRVIYRVEVVDATSSWSTPPAKEKSNMQYGFLEQIEKDKEANVNGSKGGK